MGKFEGMPCENVGKTFLPSTGSTCLFCRMVFLIPSLFLGTAYLLILAVYRYGWYISGKSRSIYPDQAPQVSVIVPMRNEARNLPELMKSLLSQKYPREKFEIILVDDGSEDNTLDMAKEYADVHPNVRVIWNELVASGYSGKKKAIETGIAVASGDWIVCTDADCSHHPLWLKALAAPSAQGKSFAAAPVVFKTNPNLLSVFQTIDFLTLQGITAASVALRFHSMCNGANLAYSRSAFYEVDGFKDIDSLPTGDDMLLMHKIYKYHPDGISYLRSKEAVVTTVAPGSWRDFFQQRIRWASKAAYYDDKRILWVLMMVYLFNAWILAIMVWAFFSQEAMGWLIILFCTKTIAELCFIWPVAGFFEKRKWLWWFPLLQPFHILYTVLAGWLGRFGSYKWKGRTILKPSTLSRQ